MSDRLIAEGHARVYLRGGASARDGLRARYKARQRALARVDVDGVPLVRAPRADACARLCARVAAFGYGWVG